DGTELGPAFRSLITAYNDPTGPQAWPYVSVAYDHQGTLHIVWTEQRIADISEHTAICHWNSVRQTVRPVAAGYYDNPNVWEKSLNLSQVTLGIGDGSTLCKDGTEANLDYLYVVYMKLGGETPEEQADVSKAGFANGELYLSASADGGHSWSPPANLSKTKTPGCTSTRPDSVCASEAWATIARDVDALNIFYIADFEAGSFSESGWTMNPTFYLRLEGGTTNAEHVCPRFGPNMVTALTADPECEYHAAPEMTNEELLTVGNIGNIALTGEVTVLPADSWLNVTGAGPFEIEATDPDLEYPVIMDAAGLTEGLYSGLIRITHNDTSKPSPIDFPIDFFVVDDFHCPEATILRTSVFGDAGVLALQVGTDGRFGAPDPAGGLVRPLDSSSAIFDATLLVAHGVQDPDTVVYHRFYNSDDPGQHGFRSVAALYIDTLQYGEGGGFAKASAQMTTKDSAIAVVAEWYYPQGAAYGDFVAIKYTLWNRTSEPLTDVAVGVYADFNVLAGLSSRAIQDGVGNHGNYVQAQNLIYMYGYDTIGHVPADHLNSSQRYSAGITYLAGRDAYGEPFKLNDIAIRGGVGDNRVNNRTTGLYYGPTSGHLHEDLVGTPGVSIWEPTPHADSAKDAYLWLTLDQGRTLEPNGVNPEVYIVALVSDTLQHPAYSIAPKLAGGLTEVVDSVWAWASMGCPGGCTKHGDPQPDGVTNVLDVVQCVNVAFRGAPPVFDDDCPWQRTDVDCTGYTDVLDVVHFVNVAFRGGDPRDEFPCVCY
ncbi:MAG TPA: hypothetical protein VM118_04465, partial [Acidobacteriota bacterium]|nr:hypothetical protein [Acidobacteriota bacterium]